VLELFICKTGIKIVLRGGYSCQRMAMRFLLSSILNRLRAVLSSWKIGICMLFYKVWHSSPLFLSQTMANRILWVPANNHIPWRSAFFLFFLKGYNGLTSSLAKLVTSRWSMRVEGYLIQYGRNPTTTPSWAKNSVTKWEVFRRFWNVAHENLLGMVWNALHRNL
jgi:hypothetical protein